MNSIFSLLPCPFDGSMAEMQCESGWPDKYWVSCKGKRCHIRSIKFSLEEDGEDPEKKAAAWWNHRAQITTQPHQNAKAQMQYIENSSEYAAKENERLLATVFELLKALQKIEGYWNRDTNESAMHDACWYAINTAKAAIDKTNGLIACRT